MSIYTRELRKAFALLVLAGATACLVGTSAVHGAIGACRSDPIVTLSNGITVDLTADIYDTPTDITGAAFTIHAPAGTSVVSVVYPLDPNGIPQTFKFFADNPPNQWDSYTVVSTKTGGISVTATATVEGLIPFAASGLAGQAIHVQAIGPSNVHGKPAKH